ncbi:Hypothetical protein SRAE_1000064000 [Strongyloides ratti]|uniref:Uncharacterized protein n=1 Tax=Strongyloides ratti TaxID=34506 RepID=A0A090L2N2_STRRB|nr:Hypothetical protein SRAE_1000064000 [Strongyloides ratti]CEF62367.1 Hypothetical protein SRAE_1000064000 [Strongyloides ratti]
MLVFINAFFYTSICLFNQNYENNLVSNDITGTMNCSIPNFEIAPEIKDESFSCYNIKENLKNLSCTSKTKNAKCTFKNVTSLPNCSNLQKNCVSLIFDCKILKNKKDSIETSKVIKTNIINKYEKSKFSYNAIKYSRDITIRKMIEKERLFLKFGHLKTPISESNFETIGIFCTIISIFSFLFLIYIIVIILLKWEEEKLESFC